jgi:hypothetical protein
VRSIGRRLPELHLRRAARLGDTSVDTGRGVYKSRGRRREQARVAHFRTVQI